MPLKQFTLSVAICYWFLLLFVSTRLRGQSIGTVNNTYPSSFHLAEPSATDSLALMDWLQRSDSLFMASNFHNATVAAEKAWELVQNGVPILPDVYFTLAYRLAEGYEYSARPLQGASYYDLAYQFAEAQGRIDWLVQLDTKFSDMKKVTRDYAGALADLERAAARVADQPNYADLARQVQIDYYSLILTEPGIISDSLVCSHCHTLWTDATDWLKDTTHQQRYRLLQIDCLSTCGDRMALMTYRLPTMEEVGQWTTSEVQRANTLQKLGRLAIRQQSYRPAEAFLNTGHALACYVENVVILREILVDQIELYASLGQQEKSLSIWPDRLHLDLQLQDRKRMASLDNLEYRLQLAEQERQIAQLGRNEAELQLDRQRLYFAVTLLVLLMGSGFYLYRRSRSQNQQMTQQNEQLQALNDTKDFLLSTIGHDLRKPTLALRGITRKVSYLLEIEDFERLQQLGRTIEDEALNLHQVTDNLLTWVLQQQSKFPVRAQRCDVQAILRTTLTLFTTPIRNKELNMENQLPTQLEVWCDIEMLRIIIRNLLDNAVKFTPHEGDITVRQIAASPTSVTIAIQNTVVNTDEPASVQKANVVSGQGLGLRIVQQLVTQNHGEVAFTSHPDNGMMVTLTLPRKY